MAGPYMLTTADNPYNPFTHYDEWRVFDEQQGYYTPAFLARVTATSMELSEVDQLLAQERGMDEIVSEDYSGLYLKVNQEQAEMQI